MANDLSAITPKIIAMGLRRLRANVPMAFLVNQTFSPTPGQKGSSVDVFIPSTMTTAPVVPGPVPPAGTDDTPTAVNVPLNNWEYAEFHMDDHDLKKAAAGYIPSRMAGAIDALARKINLSLLQLTEKFYNVVGTGGVTPFGTINDATDMGVVLSNALAPEEDRSVVMNPAAQGNALRLEAFHNASFGVGATPILEGKIDRRLGFGWHMSQLVITHTNGTGANYTVNSGPGLAIGTKTIPATGGTGTILVGDIVKFAGHTQTYVVTSALAAGSFSIEPGLVVAVANTTAIISGAETGSVPTHVINPFFHKDAIALVTRALTPEMNFGGSFIDFDTDPESGLTIRLEVGRQYKRTAWSFDALWGCEVRRRDNGGRLLG